MQERDIAGDLAAMRAEFERAFAEPRRAEREEPESLVAVRIAGAPYAFRIKELTGIAVGRRVVKLPSDVPAMVGLAGVQGRLVPVWSLAALMGIPSTEQQNQWIALCGQADQVGLAFEKIDGYLQVSPASIVPFVAQDTSRELVKELLQADGAVRPILAVPCVIDTIRRQAAAARPAKER